MTTSGSLSPRIGQSFTPGSVTLPTSTSCGGIAQGDHTTPVNAGPSPSAGTSMSLTPAACALAAARHMTVAKTSLGKLEIIQKLAESIANIGSIRLACNPDVAG